MIRGQMVNVCYPCTSLRLHDAHNMQSTLYSYLSLLPSPPSFSSSSPFPPSIPLLMSSRAQQEVWLYFRPGYGVFANWLKCDWLTGGGVVAGMWVTWGRRGLVLFDFVTLLSLFTPPLHSVTTTRFKRHRHSQIDTAPALVGRIIRKMMTIIIILMMMHWVM